MKKLSLIFVMVLAVSFAMAQKISTVNQYGSWNTASVYQYSTDGDQNSVYALQQGNNNLLNSTQIGVVFNNINYVELTQTGVDNDAYMVQTGLAYNTAKVTQSALSSYNYAAVDQTGYYNYSEIAQSGFLNRAELDQTASVYGQGTATSVSTQNGTSNTLDILQDNNAASQTATSTQNGLNNNTKVRQEGNGAQTVTDNQYGNDDIIIEQIGL